MTNPQELRKFGFTMAVALSGLFGLLLPFLWGKQFPVWPWWLALAFGALGLLFPKGLKYIYLSWMALGHVLGKINGAIILGAVFFVLITPLALFFKLIARDALKKNIVPDQKTYRIQRPEKPVPQQMLRPF